MSVPTVAALLKASALSLLEARALLAHALGSTREALVAHPEREVDGDAARRFDDLIARRSAGEPLAYLLGEREFYCRPFVVTPAVLIPRPETELLVQLAVEHARNLASPRLLDLGTGSGCIAISLALELPNAEILAVDISAAALDVARTNATRLGARVNFIESDWYSAVSDRFDMIVANPPYLPSGIIPTLPVEVERFEPHLALDGGPDGLRVLRRLVAQAPRFLRPGAWLLMEIGEEQAGPLASLMAAEGFSRIGARRDLRGVERYIEGCWAAPPAQVSLTGAATQRMSY